jgi:tight adherence protein C
MLLLAAVGFASAIALVLYATFNQADERAVIRSSLRQIEGYDAPVESVREQQLLTSFQARAIVPMLKKFPEVGHRLAPTGYIDKTREKLVHAGKVAPEDLDRFLAIRVGSLLLVPVWWFVAYKVLSVNGQLHLVVFFMLSLFSVLGPDAILNRKVADRQHEIRKTLPDVLDLLTISVEAGLGFEQALDRTVAAIPGALSEEFARMLGETRAGASRSDAMRALDERTDVPEVRSFVLAILQADTFGISIGRVLRSQAEEMRIKRRQLAQEAAQKAPIKMLFPMVFCIFPALFIVVIGPAIINIRTSFS